MLTNITGVFLLMVNVKMWIHDHGIHTGHHHFGEVDIIATLSNGRSTQQAKASVASMASTSLCMESFGSLY